MKNIFQIEKLNIRQTITVYRKCLQCDFPVNERRPLIMIIKGMLRGTYECLGAFYKGRMLGYAFFVKNGNDYLLDYFAVRKKYRCKGIGTDMLWAIRDYYKTVDSVIGEVENPMFADTDEDRETMKRRFQFYLRNGCIDTGVRSVTFGVHFIIIQISGTKLSAADAARLYGIHYRESLPRHLYQDNIKIYDEAELQ